jgi:hypothetical protein
LGVFVPLSTNNQAHGSRLLTAAGIKTALTVYDKGFLIAYDPTEITNVEEPYEDVMDIYFQLYQNYPNPFNPSTRISWQSPISGWQTIKLFDVLGREIETIVDGYYEAGPHSALYIVNSSLPSGVYFYQLKTGDYIQTKKMILLK